MRYKPVFGEEGSSTFPLIVLFGVILAFLMAFIFISIYNQQLSAQVDEQANALANNLALTAFTSLSGGQPILELPRDVGGSTYEITIEKEGIFTVTITDGRGVGNTYVAIVNASLKQIDNLSPGGHVYFRENTQSIEQIQIIVSPESIENIPAEISSENVWLTPPGFYYFAKENTKAAIAMIAAYFYALENYENIDVTSYENNDDNVCVQISYKGGDNLFGICVTVYENNENVGKVDNAWIENTLTVMQENLTNAFTNPSVENAASHGWLYSPSQALEQLRGRTWQRVSDNVMVTVPSNAEIHAAAATAVLYQENVSTYPTWRVEWQSDNYYVIYFRAMPWWENDPDPGFVFQSYPELRPVV